MTIDIEVVQDYEKKVTGIVLRDTETRQRLFVPITDVDSVIQKLQVFMYEYEAIADSMSDPLSIEQKAYSEDYLEGYEAGLEEWRNR